MPFADLRVSIAALAALLVTACGGGNSVNGAQVRFVNATLSHASLSLRVDDDNVVGSTALNTASGYADVDTGDETVQVVDASSGVALTTGTLSAGRKNHYTVLAYESGGVVKAATIDENASTPSSGTAVLNVLDAAVEAGAIDVYVAPSTSDITTISAPSFSFAVGTAAQPGTAQTFPPGTYQVRVTGAGNPLDVRLDIASFTIGSQQLATIVLAPTSGGTLVNGTVLVQQGDFTDGHNTNARLRLVAAVAGGALVSESAASAPVFVNVPTPSVSDYVLVPGGAALAVSVNNTPITTPAAPAAGSDASLLVYGDPSTATAKVLPDDNRLPGSTSTLRLRLINGLTGTTTPISLSYNLAVVASNIAPGAASGYSIVSAGTSVQLFVTAAGTTLYQTTGATITGGAIYTLFLVGPVTAPVALLRQDR